jgi:hypothetical protein
MKYADYVAISAEYGKLLVTNLMVINAGALLVFPSLLETLKDGKINLIAASCAANFFVGGLVLAGLCGYAAYLNFMWLAQSAGYDENLQIFRNKCTPEMLEIELNKVEIAKLTGNIKKNNNLGQTSLYVGNVLGLASGIAFCLGCYYLHEAVRL